jgi:UDP-2,4-diacetamido-2,4,6-trideoxy-beta-L-altropyranose hydrolase
MNIVFRADASVHIGSGHIMRCLVLAKILKDKGHNVNFFTRPQKGDFVDYIKQQNIQVVELKKINNIIKPKANNDYEAWLQTTWLDDANDFIEKASYTDLVIVDHYGIDKKWEKHVSQSLNCKMFIIDDLIREHYADLILDQTFGRQQSEYVSTAKKTKILVGSHYSLLAPQYSELRIEAEKKQSISPKYKVLVTMGAIDAPNVTLKVLNALSTIQNINVTVLLSPRAPHYDSVKLYCKINPLIIHIDFSEDVANLMLEHDIAIGAPGSTSWERACLGLPSIIIPIADNQIDIAEKIAKSGAAITLNIENIESDFKVAFKDLVHNWLEYRVENFKLTDGLGVFRVTYEIEKLSLETSSNVDVSCRLADKKDIKQVYNWQILPETRKYALNNVAPELKEHTEWMLKKLEALSDYFYIIEIENKTTDKHPAGVVRLDKTDINEYLISIFIDPEFYGQQIAQQALIYIDTVHSKNTINATILNDNTASQKLFKRANYKKIAEQKYQRSPLIN